MSIEFDYSKLRGRIKEKIGSETEIARLIGLSTVSLSSKLNNKTGFSQDEMEKIRRLLDIRTEDMGSYFLKVKTKKT